jgi:AraC-like DNA-binding protein
MATTPQTSFRPAPVLSSIGNAGRVRCEPGWELAPGWSERLHDHDLWCVWAGRGELRTSDGRLRLHPGIIVWMRPGRRYEATQDLSARLGVSFMHFTPRVNRTWRPPFEAMETRDLTLVEAMADAVIARRTAAPHVAATLLQTLLTALAQEARDARSDTTNAVERRHREVVERAALQITESPADAPALAALAREAGYSVDHFSRVFAQIKGLGPQAFIVRARVERAKQLLAETSLTVGEVAAMLGYSDVYFFSRQFRQVAGVPPRVWRERSPIASSA